MQPSELDTDLWPRSEERSAPSASVSAIRHSRTDLAAPLSEGQRNGNALRFRRIVRIREDNPVEEIATVDRVEERYELFFGCQTEDELAELADNFFFSSRRRHTSSLCDWSSDVCSSD